MAKKRRPSNQLDKALPEYGELKSIMENETASIISDYIRQYVNIGATNEPGSGIFLNFDRVLNTQSYQELAWYDLYAEVERDTHVSSIIQSAKLNVAGMKYDILPFIGEKEKKASARNEEIASFVKRSLKRTGYFPQHLFNLMDSIGKGFAISEIVWKIGDRVTIGEILNRPQRRFQFDAVTRVPKLRDINNPYMGDVLPEKKFIVHRVTQTWENPFGDALDQSIYWMWRFKKLVTKFWMTNLEVGASSIPIVQHPTSATSAVKAEALAIAKSIRNGAYGRLPESFKIIWAEASGASQSSEAYDKFILRCDEQISKAINGQTLTSEAGSASGKGTQALGNVHQGTQNSRDVFRAKGLSATLNATLIRWLVDFNFGQVEGYPKFRFDLEEADDLLTESSIVKNLTDAGYDFDEKELSEKFNYTLKKKQPLELKPDPNAKPDEELENNKGETK